MNFLANGQTRFSLQKDSLDDGISHITVFNGDRIPVCERLYFKQPKQQLHIGITTATTAPNIPSPSPTIPSASPPPPPPPLLPPPPPTPASHRFVSHRQHRQPFDSRSVHIGIPPRLPPNNPHRQYPCLAPS